jgi:hypothetical protein
MVGRIEPTHRGHSRVFYRATARRRDALHFGQEKQDISICKFRIAVMPHSAFRWSMSSVLAGHEPTKTHLGLQHEVVVIVFCSEVRQQRLDLAEE